MRNSGETALVTGGTGFTGSHLVRALLDRGDRVRVLARSRERARETLPEEVEVVVGDIADPDAVERAVVGCDAAYHLAAAFREAGIPDSRYHQVHVDGTRLVLEAAKRHGLRRVVHCSTIGVHGHIANPPADETAPVRPGDIYQETKSAGERLALRFGEEHDLPVSVARPASIYGPGDLRLLKLFRMIARRRFVMLGRGDVGFHTVYVEDLVRGFLLLADRDEAVGETFILAGERSVPLRELVRIIAETLDVPAPRIRLPVAPVMAAAHVIKAVCVPLRIEPPLYPRRVAFFTKHREFTIEKARRVLGYEPEVDLETGIRRTAEWYVEEGLVDEVSLAKSGTGEPARRPMTEPVRQVVADLLDDRPRHETVEEVLPPEEHRTWALWRSAARFLGNLAVAHGSRSVLEFGSGQSSIVLARAVAHNGGGRVTSVEHMPEYSEAEWAQVEEVEDVDAELIQSSLRLVLRPEGPRYEYREAMPAIAQRAPFDMVFIDGPPFFYGRDGTLPPVLDFLERGALIVLDDARRGAEQRMIRRWLKTRPGLELILLDPGFGGDRGYGVAVMRYDGDPRREPSASAFLRCWLDQALTWRHPRWKLRSLAIRPG